MGPGKDSDCPYCHRPNDIATDMRGGAIGAGVPKSGDVGICFACGGVQVYTGEGMNVRRPTNTERDVYLQDPEIIAVLSAWQQYHLRERDA